MEKSISDLIAYFGGPRKQTHPHSEVLRARAALTFGMQATGMTLTQFNRKFVEPVVGGADSKIGFKWWNGDNIPSRRSIEKIDNKVPGILSVFLHDFFLFLLDDQLSEKRIEKALSQWRSHDDRGPYWKFTDALERRKNRRIGDVEHREGLQRLFERGDIPGFSVVLGLMRSAEASKNTQLHIECAKYAYRYFPTIVRIPWMKPSQHLLRYCLQHVHMRDLLSFIFIGVDWTIIKFQIGLERHELDPWRLQEEWLVPPFDPVWDRLQFADNRLVVDPLRPHQGRRADCRAFVIASGRAPPRSKHHPRNRGNGHLFVPKSAVDKPGAEKSRSGASGKT